MCDGNKVKIYNGHTAKITISEKVVMKGRRYPQQNLWRAPLKAHVTNINVDTILLDGPTGTKSMNLL